LHKGLEVQAIIFPLPAGSLFDLPSFLDFRLDTEAHKGEKELKESLYRQQLIHKGKSIPPSFFFWFPSINVRRQELTVLCEMCAARWSWNPLSKINRIRAVWCLNRSSQSLDATHSFVLSCLATYHLAPFRG
jgi:hypothetical protein